MLSIPLESDKHRTVYGDSEVSRKLNVYLNTAKTRDYVFLALKQEFQSWRKKKVKKKNQPKKRGEV